MTLVAAPEAALILEELLDETRDALISSGCALSSTHAAGMCLAPEAAALLNFEDAWSYVLSFCDDAIKDALAFAELDLQRNQVIDWPQTHQRLS